VKPNQIDFDHVLAPITQQTFFDDYFEKRHLVVKRGDPQYWGDLLTFEDVDRVVSTMGLCDPEIKVTNNTGHAPGADHDNGAIRAVDYAYSNGQVDPVRIAKLFADGGTVILSGLHDRLPKLARFARSLEAVLSCRVQTNAYMTPGGNQGFRPHYDTHDVIVLQLEGTKEWRIYGTPIALPLASQGFAPDALPIGEEVDRFVLEPGDTAYLPRGLAHDAIATGETSLHITTGLMFRTWADLVAEAVHVLAAKDVAFRAALPPGFANCDRDISAMAPRLAELLQHAAKTVPAAALINDFKQDFISGRLSRVEGQLSEVVRARDLSGDTRVGARPDLIYELTSGSGAEPLLMLSVHGTEITLPAHVEEPLRFALATRDFLVSELPGDLDEAGKIVLIQRLIREGMVMRC